MLGDDAVVISLENPVTRTYMVHAALLAVKLLALSPMAAMTWVHKGWFAHPDVVRRAYFAELKCLAPFWVVGALYVTTEPRINIAISLFRLFSLARGIVVIGYGTKPLPPLVIDIAFICSYFITCFMAVKVVLLNWRSL